MTKVSRKPLDPEKFGHYINNLWSAFTLMDSKADVRLLFKDLFTHTEYKMFAKRLEIARQLINGESYENIQKALNVTSGTVGRVSNILTEKGEGLKQAHKKLNELENKYLKLQQEKTKNLQNPFRQRMKNYQKTVLGETLKAGAIALDRTISKTLKRRTAEKKLEI